MPLQSNRAARQTRAAPLSQPQTATILGTAQNSRATLSRQAAIARAADHVEAARADLAAVLAEDQHAASVNEIAALAAVVAVLRVSGKSLAPGEAAFIVGRTEPTIITWCRKSGIGAKAGGRWLVDPLRLALHLLGCAS